MKIFIVLSCVFLHSQVWAQNPTDGIAIVSGGFGAGISIEAINTSRVCSNSQTMPPLPQAAIGYEDFTLDFVDNKFWQCGGKDTSRQSQCYSLDVGATNWQTNEDFGTPECEGCLNVERSEHSSVVVDGILYILGGYNNNRGFLNSIESKERGGVKWTELTSRAMPSTLMYTCAAPIGTTGIMVAGGQPEAFVYSTDQAWSLDLTTGVWTPELSMGEGVRAGHACIDYTLNGDQGMLLTGGCNVAGCDEETAKVEFFNYRTKAWSTLNPMKKARSHHTLAWVGDQVAAIAGDSSIEGTFDSIEFFDGRDWTMSSMTLSQIRYGQGTPSYVSGNAYKCY